MKKGKNMINQKNDLNMITRKLETELLSFHFDGLEISEITTTTSWMKLQFNVLFIKDDVQITKVLYKDYETGLWYYIKDNGMIISHKDTFNHTIKNLIDEMIYDCHIEIEEVEETKATEEVEETKATETSESSKIEEATEDYNEYEEILDSKESTEHDRIKYLMDTHSLVPHVTINSHCMETVLYMEELLTQRFGNTIAHKCKMYNNGYYGCPADRQGNRCGGEQWCKETWKRYEAIINPEWHHVSLATLANIDFDMLDKKRQVYLKAHRELKRTLADLSKCKTGHTYEARARKFMRDMISQYYDNEISYAMRKYLDLQLSMSNVVNGVWSSYVEPATGLHESRRYSRPTLTY